MLKTLNRKLKHRLYRRDYERMLHLAAPWCSTSTGAARWSMSCFRG